MYAYVHTPPNEETKKLTSFPSCDKLFAFIRGFCDLKIFPNFFTKQMSSFFKPLLDQTFAPVNIDILYSFQIEKNPCSNLLKTFT